MYILTFVINKFSLRYIFFPFRIEQIHLHPLIEKKKKEEETIAKYN